jgi:hypothetical protein
MKRGPWPGPLHRQVRRQIRVYMPCPRRVRRDESENELISFPPTPHNARIGINPAGEERK